MPRPEAPYESREPHSCWDHCWDQKRERWKIKERQQRGCTRSDLPEVEWHVDVELLRTHQGSAGGPHMDRDRWRLPADALNSVGQPWWRTPGEDPAEGCPAGWIRCEFAESVMPYLRTRTEHGGRVQNMRLDDTEDRLVKDAVLYFEQCEERRIGWMNRLALRKMQAERS